LVKLKADIDKVFTTGNNAAQTVELDQTRMGRLSRMDALQQQAMSKASKQRRLLKLQQIDKALERISPPSLAVILFEELFTKSNITVSNHQDGGNAINVKSK